MDHRTESGIERTNCACETCRLNCRIMPGCLIPSDLERIIPAGVDPFRWAESNLRASPGALVANTATGETFRIPTLVPATKTDGSCIHLTALERCDIHEIAPAGCAFFDCGPEPPGLMREFLIQIQDAWREPGPSLYRNLWAHLAYAGLEAIDPREARERMRLTIAQ